MTSSASSGRLQIAFTPPLIWGTAKASNFAQRSATAPTKWWAFLLYCVRVYQIQGRFSNSLVLKPISKRHTFWLCVELRHWSYTQRERHTSEHRNSSKPRCLTKSFRVTTSSRVARSKRLSSVGHRRTCAKEAENDHLHLAQSSQQLQSTWQKLNRKEICFKNINNTPAYWWGKQNAARLKFDPKPSEAIFSAVFSHFDKCRSEVAGDVISSAAVK